MPIRESREISVRLYHEDTLDIQNTFRNWIELLIKNKGIIPASQRNTFFISLSKATFEIGRGKQIFHITKDKTRLRLGTFYSFAQMMTYQKHRIVKIRYPPRTGKIYEIPIEDLWRTLLKHFLKIAPYALEEARRLSAERFRLQAKPGVVEWSPGEG